MSERPDEFALIEEYLSPLSGEGSFALRDDAAILAVPEDHDLVVTTDAIAETVHFLAGTDPETIARKAVRVNLSDLAAKGARPFALSLALGLPQDWTRRWIAAFAKGLESDCQEYRLTLSGGDTFRSPAGAVIAITAFGAVKRGGYAARPGAAPGARLYVTGTIGDAVLGLDLARRAGDLSPEAEDADTRFLIGRYDLPRPRLAAAPLIAEYASAAIDISDGFAGDLEKLCAASRLSVRLAADRVPLSAAARRYRAAHADCRLETLLSGGDDYELLIAVPPESAAAFEKAARDLPFELCFLAVLEDGMGEVEIVDSAGTPLRFASASYIHFSGRPGVNK